MLVVLSSDEHDDTEQFCRQTLTNEDLIEFIQSKNMLVWAGNVGQSEAHQVSCTLQATTYPFMAVIALHSAGGSAPKMSVVDRLEGPIPPATLIQRLDITVQRHGAVMNRMKMERDQRDMERRLREEQDQAYLESLKADQEKERKAQEERKALALEEEKRQHAQQEHERYLKKRQQYIHYLFHTLSDEPGADYQGKITKLNFRLANGDRVIRKFKETDSIETLYQFVETYPLLQSDEPKPSPILSPPSDYQHKYQFTIHSPFPRTVYQAQDSDRCLLDVPSLWPSATLIVDVNDEDDEDDD
ncbi:hypothetical protein BCR42DRAFT_329118 [Absidia repens]|uniref:UBX domain-containing protein n=1 Tax=Absidia repens TaxID=90262 RepID=A0A1X2IDC5_9FUNG|nr:hypothetical protein BCR42DRAFT_329118 [Absidia repens]